MSIECKVLNRWVRDNKDRKNFKDPVTAKEWSELLKDFTVGARHTAANLACHNWDVTIIGDRLLMHSHWSKGKWYDKGSNTPVAMTDEEWAVLHHGEKDRYGVPPDPDFQRLADFLQAREAVALFASAPKTDPEPGKTVTSNYEFPYRRTFDSIAAAVEIYPSKEQALGFSVSVRKFQEAFNGHRDAAFQQAPAAEAVTRPERKDGAQ